jgi:purine nucleoside permease
MTEQASTRHIPLVALALALLVPLLGACSLVNNLTVTVSRPDRRERTVILTAFGDPQATYGETQPFLLALEHKVVRTADSAYCEGVYEGQISGQDVVVVTTGTGGDNSGPCMQELLQMYRTQIKEVIWSGIGGVTPAVGGLVDGTGARRADAEPVMIGDVCISALAWNYDLHFSSVSDWAAAAGEDDQRYDPAGGWWSMKSFTGTTEVIGFDNVRQFVTTTTTLADELLGAAQQVTWPAMDSGVQEKVERYFPSDQVRPFDYTQCGEVGGNNFWHGVVEDRLSRQYLAGLIAASGYTSATVSEDTVVVFSAMEAQAWMSVLERWNEHYGAQIPMAVIRAASNYDHLPLDADGNPPLGPNGQPMTGMDDILEGFQTAGEAFAAGNAAAPMLKLLQLRGQEPEQ